MVFACGFSWCYSVGSNLFLLKSVLMRTGATQLKSWWLYIVPYVPSEWKKKIIPSSKLQRKIKFVVSVTFATLCSLKNTFCSWSLTTAHWREPIGFQHSVFNIKCLYICKHKLVMWNISLGTNTHLNLWSPLWFWLNSCICSKGSNKFMTLSVREDRWTVASSWFTVNLFSSSSQHTNAFCYRAGIWKSFQRGNNVSWSLLNS